jgi:PAS domain S-box-containing protein
MKVKGSRNASLPPPEEQQTGQNPAENTPLRQAEEQITALRQALAQTQQELNQLKAASGSAREDTHGQRMLALEQLGKQVLEKNAAPGSTLEEIIQFYLAGVEKLHPGIMCACMHLQGERLYVVAAPSLPPAFIKTLNGLHIKEACGSCAVAAAKNQAVVCADIATNPICQSVKEEALASNLKASWSLPLVGAGQKVLGTLGVYYHEARGPLPEEEESVGGIQHLLQLILENKLAEQELRQSNERYYFATRATNDAVWDLDITCNTIRWGIGFEKLFGFKVKEFGPELNIWAAQVHPDDLTRVTASLHEVISGRRNDHWREEYRFRKANGEYAYVVDQGSLIKDAQGNPVRMVGAVQDITDQKQAEEELRKLSVVARETINGVIIMRPDFTIQWINHSFTKMMGYTLEEMAGKTLDTFMTGPNAEQNLLALMADKVKNVETLECEIPQFAKDGKKLWLKVQMQPLLDAQGKVENVFALLTDISQQKAEELRLRLLGSVVTNSQDAIIISKVNREDPSQLQAVFFNRAFFRMTGYSQEEVQGKDPSFLNGPKTDPDTSNDIMRLMEAGQPCEAELECHRKDGTSFWIQLLLIPMLNRSNRLTHWISMLRDITARKHYEREREGLIAELTQNNADLKQFTFITSHNLRAPLANLTGIVSMIDSASIPEGRNRLLFQKFKESTVKLNTIIDDLLEVLVIKNNPNSNKEPLSLAAAFEKVMVSVDGLFSNTDIQFTTDFSQVPQVYYNASYLHSILLNLLTNAIKYRSPDRPLHIEVKAEKVNGRELLYFSDNGLGIDLNKYGERIFGLYQRFHSHKDSKGMGLYIAHSQAKAMGGNLSVTSKVNQGTTFILEF